MTEIGSEYCELDDLRKTKAKVLVAEIKDALTYGGEDLGKTTQLIEDLLGLQKKRCEAFRKLFEGKKDKE